MEIFQLRTKNVSDMAYMFSGATTFNKDISSWNVDNVSTMEKGKSEI
nr:BspA family leucine-rich repeat surface protein [Mycoplasmopsis bovis]